MHIFAMQACLHPCYLPTLQSHPHSPICCRLLIVVGLGVVDVLVRWFLGVPLMSVLSSWACPPFSSPSASPLSPSSPLSGFLFLHWGVGCGAPTWGGGSCRTGCVCVRYTRLPEPQTSSLHWLQQNKVLHRAHYRWGMSVKILHGV